MSPSDRYDFELIAALQRLADEADRSLDYRPEFRRAIADAYSLIAQTTATEAA